jgi:hypothetical protein
MRANRAMKSWKQKRDQRTTIWTSGKAQRDRIWFGTTKRRAYASASTETARNRLSLSIGVIPDSTSSDPDMVA